SRRRSPVRLPDRRARPRTRGTASHARCPVQKRTSPLRSAMVSESCPGRLRSFGCAHPCFLINRLTLHFFHSECIHSRASIGKTSHHGCDRVGRGEDGVVLSSPSRHKPPTPGGLRPPIAPGSGLLLHVEYSRRNAAPTPAPVGAAPERRTAPPRLARKARPEATHKPTGKPGAAAQPNRPGVGAPTTRGVFP